MKVVNFIGVAENALADSICDDLVSHLQSRSGEANRDNKSGGYGDEQFLEGKLGREDFQLFQPQNSNHRMTEMLDCAFNGLESYKHIVASVRSGGPLISEVVKLQHTPVGGGFHEWHCEQGGGHAAARSLVWMIYLNDVTDGGDTEFLYQHMKVQPKKGTLVIWPAGLTHPHRGNPPYSNDKYVATGWFEVPMYEVYRRAVNHFKQANQDG